MNLWTEDARLWHIALVHLLVLDLSAEVKAVAQLQIDLRAIGVGMLPSVKGVASVIVILMIGLAFGEHVPRTDLSLQTVARPARRHAIGGTRLEKRGGGV